MKKNVYLLTSILFLILFAGEVFAGDYHNQVGRQVNDEDAGGSVTLVCAQCHTMHGTQGGNSSSLIYDRSLNTYNKLIRENSVVALCKYCHDGDPATLGAPDLFTPPYNASAGNYEVVNEKRHDIGVDLTGIEPPGYSGSNWTGAQSKYGSVFSCIYCHDQHGNENYRNVRPNPLEPSDRDPATAGARVTYDNASWGTGAIFQNVIDGSGDGSDPANQYSTDNMSYRRHDDNGEVIQIAGFCGKCHVNFYGEGGSSNLGGSSGGDNGQNTKWKRHPVGGINIGVGNGHTDPENFLSIPATDRVRTINPNGDDTGADEQPFCFSCHRAHGSTNHSNLIFGSPTSIGGADTMMRDTCQQCHNQ